MVTTAKEQLRKLVGELSEAEAAADLKLGSRRRSALVALMESAPVDDEPFTEQDDASFAESYDELVTGGQAISIEKFRRQA